jgi:hypothetical protein
MKKKNRINMTRNILCRGKGKKVRHRFFSPTSNIFSVARATGQTRHRQRTK